jgi:Icc-related predicted phosphoesterase
MKLQALSDLHREMMGPLDWQDMLQTLLKGEADVLVLAGDLVPLIDVRTAEPTFRDVCERYWRVVYVPGNHEYYGTDPLRAAAVLEQVEDAVSNLTVLRNGPCSIRDQQFYGGTMWFENLPRNWKWKNQLNDFSQIKRFEPWVYEQNRAFTEAARLHVTSGTVVVSHHLPLFLSVAERHRLGGMDSPNAFFVSDQAGLISEKRPKLWIHGHTHAACDYTIGSTRVVCSPLGYVFELADWPAPVFVDV